MSLFHKILRAGDSLRVSRFHTLRGEIIPLAEFIGLPFEFFLRLIGIHRAGPWICKPAVRFLNGLLDTTPALRVLEIGGGRSSKYFSERAGSLLTVEEDSDWAQKIVKMVNKENYNFDIVITGFEEWLGTRNSTNMDFDLILIDGSTDALRKKAIEILPKYNKSAIYILDNSDRLIFRNIDFCSPPKRIVQFNGLVRHPFQATETTFFWF